MFIEKTFEYAGKPRECEAVPWYSKGRFQRPWLLFSLMGWIALSSGPAYGGSPQTKSKIVHKVAAQETIYGIAKKYKVSPHDLKVVNGLRKDKILVGQTLFIPGAATESLVKPNVGTGEKQAQKPKAKVSSASARTPAKETVSAGVQIATAFAETAAKATVSAKASTSVTAMATTAAAKASTETVAAPTPAGTQSATKPVSTATPDSNEADDGKKTSGAETQSAANVTASNDAPQGSGADGAQQVNRPDAAPSDGEAAAASATGSTAAAPKPTKQSTGSAKPGGAKQAATVSGPSKKAVALSANAHNAGASVSKSPADAGRQGWHYRTPSSANTQTAHKVVKGDTLLDIASRYKTTVSRIMAANKLTSSVIKTGQSLKIPLPADEQVVSRSWPGNFDQNVWLLARLITGEARGEPYEGQVAVAAVALNRLMHPSFPKTLQGVVLQKGAFTAVNDGQFKLRPSYTSIKAAQEALEGWDPSCGALYYYNPKKATARWSFLRPAIKKIGDHVFTR